MPKSLQLEVTRVKEDRRPGTFSKPMEEAIPGVTGTRSK